MLVRACSGWSLGCGAVRLEALLEWARRSGLRAICQADFDNLYGAIAFYEQARRGGLRPILGAILTEPAPDEPRTRPDDRDDPGADAAQEQPAGDARGDDPPAGRTKVVVRRFDTPQVVAIACNLAGYENLCRLVTARHMARMFDLAEAAGAHQEGLVFLARQPDVLGRLARTVGPAGLFAEVHDHGTEADRLHNYRLLGEAERLGVAPVACHAALFERAADRDLHRVLRAVVLNKPAAWIEPAQLAPAGAWLAPAERIRARLAGHPRAVRNAEALIERCDVELQLGVAHFPRMPLEPGETAISRLARLAAAGLAKRYRLIPPAGRPRLERELRIIEKLGFAHYFLVVHDIVVFARRKGIGCVGRGSAADSLVTYCLGISDADPLRYELHFERFLNESRTDWPDIDLDFDWRRRDEVIRYVYQRWGASRVAMITTQHFYRARSAFRDAARALGMPTERLNDLTGRLPYDEPDNLPEAIASLPECRDFPLHDPQVAEAIGIARRMAGLPRGLSVHVGGVVIADRPITCYTPLQPATKGIAVTQYDMHAIEKVGLVKIDLLGHRSLAILADALALIRRHHNVRLDLRAVPEDEEATARTLAAGRTIGCFQIESPGMRQLLQMIRAKDLLDVIHALSLIRPGPSASGMKERFIQRKRGLEPVTYPHPAMAEVLADTYGVMLYQEDVMRVAAAVAGFTMATGDQLRKALEKPDRQEYLAGLKGKFLAGARQRGCDEATAEQIWMLVSNFAAYSYNKAHACTYGRIAYWCAYLKTHWPAAFLTAVLNNVGGYYSISEYLEEARRGQAPILPPNVNASEVAFAAEPVAVQPVLARRRNDRVPGSGFQVPGATGGLPARASCGPEDVTPSAAGCHGRDVCGHARREGAGCKNYPGSRHGVTLRRVGIRVGLRQVRGLSERAARQIVEQRTKRPFAGLEDLLRRVRLSLDEVRALILSGACDGLGVSRPAMLWQLALWRSRPTGPPADPTLFPETERPSLPRVEADGLERRSDAAMLTKIESLPAVPDEAKRSAAGTAPEPFEVSNPDPSGQVSNRDLSRLEPRALPEHLLADYDRRRLLELERQYLSLAASDHPMAGWEDALAGQERVRSIDLPGLVGRVMTIAGVVAAKRRAATSKGELMEFVTLEDRWGLVEVVLFPDAYRRLGSVFCSPGPYLVRGRVQSNLGAVVLVGRSARRVEDPERDHIRGHLAGSWDRTRRLEG